MHNFAIRANSQTVLAGNGDVTYIDPISVALDRPSGWNSPAANADISNHFVVSCYVSKGA